MSMRIYTKTGDSGETGLFGGARVAKDDLRVEAYGSVDELNSHLAVALAAAGEDAEAQTLQHIMWLLFELGAQLATDPNKNDKPGGLRDDDVAWLEAQIDRLEEGLPPLKTFVLPGGNAWSASLNVARTACRRAERRVVSLGRADAEGSAMAIRFLNRLADHLFVLARYANVSRGDAELPWRPRD